jgi:hypothetical protein
MAVKYSTLRGKMTKAERAESAELANKLRVSMVLADLRAMLCKTQEEMALALGATQASVSKRESQNDMLVSSLNKYVAAMGGRLELRVHLAGGREHSITLGRKPSRRSARRAVQVAA